MLQLWIPRQYDADVNSECKKNCVFSNMLQFLPLNGSRAALRPVCRSELLLIISFRVIYKIESVTRYGEVVSGESLEIPVPYTQLKLCLMVEEFNFTIKPKRRLPPDFQY